MRRVRPRQRIEIATDFTVATRRTRNHQGFTLGSPGPCHREPSQQIRVSKLVGQRRVDRPGAASATFSPSNPEHHRPPHPRLTTPALGAVVGLAAHIADLLGPPPGKCLSAASTMPARAAMIACIDGPSREP